jgi:hypothetical protein
VVSPRGTWAVWSCKQTTRATRTTGCFNKTLRVLLTKLTKRQLMHIYPCIIVPSFLQSRHFSLSVPFLNLKDFMGFHPNSSLSNIPDVAEARTTSIIRAMNWHMLIHRPDDGGSRHVWNVGPLQRDHTSIYPRKLSFSIIQFLWRPRFEPRSVAVSL